MSTIRGERDYTQRVLAAIRPSGIVGGYILMKDDMEAINPKYVSFAGTVGFTQATGEVWEGDQALKYSMIGSADATATWGFPCPTPSIISAEVIFRPSSTELKNFYLAFGINDGVNYDQPQLWITNAYGNLGIYIRNSAGTLTKLYEYTFIDFGLNWHMLFLEFDLSTMMYVMCQYDNIRINLKNYPIRQSIGFKSSDAAVTVTASPKAAITGYVYVDNLTLTYSEE